MTRARTYATLVVVCGTLTLASACSKDPDEQAREYLASGDEYAHRQQYDAAAIQYRNAIKQKPDLADAHYKLAKAYEASADSLNAYGAYTRAADLQPANVDAQLKAGGLLLAAGEYGAARNRAQLALKADPKNAAAHILLGNALAGLNETGRAIKQMEQAIALDPSYAPAWSALGAVRFVGGNRATAGEAFRKAIALAPKSVDAHLALANYHWASGNQVEAKGALDAALAAEPGSPAAHRALALFYLVSKRAPEAEPHFKALAGEPGGVLALADYYLATRRTDLATAALRDVAAKTDHADSKAARVRLASIDYQSGRKAEAHVAIDAVLKEHAGYADARVAKARMLLLDGGSVDQAEQHAREAVAADRRSPAAHYTAGLVALQREDAAAAEQSFREVLKLNSRAGAAQLQLARIQLSRGDAAGALSSAEAAARQRPSDPEAAVLVSRSLRAQGDLPRAERELAARLAAVPQSAALHVEMGEVALQRGQLAAARSSFEEALRLDGTLHAARVGVITADVAERNVTSADARLAAWRKDNPADSRLKVLTARVDLAAGRTAEAERSLRELVTADASQLEAYDLLGRLYLGQGQIDRAETEYRALAAKAKSPAGALTMIGLIAESRGDREAARKEYEQVLAVHPRAGVAANNLAWIYAETGRADEAIRLATIAQEELRGRPEPEDTLGWAYYHKGRAGNAIEAFERAITLSPRNALYHYHLGLAHAKAGGKEPARLAFQRALALKGDFAGADDARNRLKALGG